jgi:hypothetical protein
MPDQGNIELADAAERMADAQLSGTDRRKACACAAVALRYTTTPAAAQRTLERHPLEPALRAAALALIDQLLTEPQPAEQKGPAQHHDQARLRR